MKRTAKCLCGKLSVTVKEKPLFTVVCNCTNCQRRTGSAFATNAYFANGQVVSISGEANSYRNTGGPGGRSYELFFCPSCGGCVYFYAEFKPGHIGIPVGTFNDPNFQEPAFSGWNRSKLKWVKLPDHWLHAEKQEIPPEVAAHLGLPTS